ncbi:MAG TPA: hypothetical protein VGJ20_37430, partial [Xanthobacteraceae bacterium]
MTDSSIGISRSAVVLAFSAILLFPFFGVSRFSVAADTDTAIAAETSVSPPASATLSPNGLRAVWQKENGAGFWFAERAGDGKWTRPRQIGVRGVVRTPVFSPDGNKL